MSTRRARITAAYATLKLVDPLNGLSVRGFYRDAITPVESDPASVAALVRRGYAEWFEGDEPEPAAKGRTAEDKAAEDAAARQLEDAAPKAAEPAEPVEPEGDTTGDTTGEAKDGDKPKPYASKEAWLAYAVSQRAEGVSEEDALAALEGKSKNDLIAEFG